MAKLETNINFDLLSDAFSGILSTTAVLYGWAKVEERPESARLLEDIINFAVTAISIVDTSGRFGSLCAKKARDMTEEAFELADKEIDERADVLVN